MSATMSSEARYASLILPPSTISRIKWYFMSICLVLPWTWEFLVRHMVDWLSLRMVVSRILLLNRSLASCQSHIASWEAADSATYSASAVERAMQVCLLLLQLMAAPAKRNTYPEVDFLSPTSPAQSASEYPVITAPSSCYYLITHTPNTPLTCTNSLCWDVAAMHRLLTLLY